MDKNKFLKIIKNKKVQWAVAGVALLIILILGSLIRVSNLPLLVDQTTGENIPLALDPFYFLRLSQTIVDDGELPEIDNMRYPSQNIKFGSEITPFVTVFMLNFAKIFNSEVTLGYINVVSPVVLFVFGIILFFFLIYFLTKSKIVATLSSGFLSITPMYLYRTMAGFSDHEAVGMVGFFFALLCVFFAFKFLDNKKENKLIESGALGLLVGLSTVFTIVSWGGISTFLFMIVPFGFFINWVLKTKDPKNYNLMWRYLVFYISWVISSLIVGGLIGIDVLNRYLLSSTGILSVFVLAFCIIDFVSLLLIRKNYKASFKKIYEKFRLLINLVVSLVVGTFFLSLAGHNVLDLFFDIIAKVVNPFGTGRVGLTVAENSQPYLSDLIRQVGNWFFFLFFVGLIILGIKISEGISIKKHRYVWIASWVGFVSSLLFSRFSAGHILNGENFLSIFILIIGVGFFVFYTYWVYVNGEFKIPISLVLILALVPPMLLAIRSALRLFFAITPFICFVACFGVFELFKYAMKSKDDVGKIFLWVCVAVAIIILVSSSIEFYNGVSAQAKNTGPSANWQWQETMSWVRNNTAEDSIFLHWWDYGYWVQTLGERATVTDGGHYIGYWDHLIGRYVLTTPNQNSALSFAKTHNASYLLIDQTDIGKYSAYSSIGDSKNKSDRYSWVPTMQIDKSQTIETNISTVSVYIGGGMLDDDLRYTLNNNSIFLPKGKAYIGAVLAEHQDNQILQAKAVFFYNEKRFQIPLRYLYLNNQLIDFGSGIDAGVYLIPSIKEGGVIPNGALMYLSPKIFNSLVTQLYILNDPSEKFKGFNLVHSEDNGISANLKGQGLNEEFVYYDGIGSPLMGPMKIWEIDYPENIIAHDEFLRTSGEWGEFDSLKFIE